MSAPSPRTGDDRARPDLSARHQFAWVGPAAIAVARRPQLWGVAVGQCLRLAAPGWWRRWPPLPLPDPSYLRFRLETGYGDGPGPGPADVISYLRWCRRFRLCHSGYSGYPRC